MRRFGGGGLFISDRQNAEGTPFTPDGSIAATNVQAAIQEVRDEAGGGGAVARAGGNLTEATTTSTSSVDLLTASSLTIAAVQPLMASASLRRTTGAAAVARTGLKLNATEVRSQAQWSGSADATESGMVHAWASPRVTNYLMGGWIFRVSIANTVATAAFDVAAPAVEITDLIIRGNVSSALITMGADELNAYSYANS